MAAELAPALVALRAAVHAAETEALDAESLARAARRRLHVLQHEYWRARAPTYPAIIRAELLAARLGVTCVPSRTAQLAGLFKPALEAPSYVLTEQGRVARAALLEAGP